MEKNKCTIAKNIKKMKHLFIYDRYLFFTVLVAVIFGLLMITSAAAIYATLRFEDQYFFLKRQIIFGVLPGFLALFLLARIDYHVWKRWSVVGFIGSLIALGLVFVPGIGTSAYGATRWIDLGFISFQPSEMAKLAIIIYLAAWLSSKGQKQVGNVLEGLIPFIVVLSFIGFFIYKQPDVGTLGLIIAISFIMFFSAGAQLSHIFTMAGLGSFLFFILIRTASYRWDRFMTFLNPSSDPQGKGYQINQALIAIGSGSFWGVGLGQSRQKFNYLPEPVGDSIFAIIGEELGFIGTIFTLSFFIFLVTRGLLIAKNAPDEFGRLLAIGITSWIGIQAIFNISAITGIMPLTGMPLPFISYGGTSLAFSLAAMGILLNISSQTIRR
ncbi:MAG: putative lipid II flippase FtsW [Candidatus Moranbacteria bacterium]|nr:putative lipid II flippase FtsW [Candidatus Moranbacteria bacterium]